MWLVTYQKTSLRDAEPEFDSYFLLTITVLSPVADLGELVTDLFLRDKESRVMFTPVYFFFITELSAPEL